MPVDARCLFQALCLNEPLGASMCHQAPSALRRHQERRCAIRCDKEPPGATRDLQVPQDAPKAGVLETSLQCPSPLHMQLQLVSVMFPTGI